MDSLEEILNLDSTSVSRTIQKGTLLQSAGAKSNRAFYVKKGLLRSYTIDQKGKEHLFMFAAEGWLMADVESQEFDQPAALFIDCLEDTELVVFDRSCFKIANLSVEQLRRNAHLLARRTAVLQRRVIMLMSASAKDRYQHFLETYPKLPNRVPQRMIASYLGITPQALSTIRGRLSKNILP
jgi:CRP-like cAMP-binding protein